MRINHIILENFGLYKGLQKFKLNPEDKRNIILIGGKNGNGKTTFFEGIKLCLYGRTMFGPLNPKKYEKIIREKIHHLDKTGENSDHASVEVEFEHTRFGITEKYTISRRWMDNGEDIQEELNIKKNGSELNEIESENWQDFINELIPFGLSKLFFFDGEKIQDLAEEIEENKQLEESFKSLMGIEIIEKLNADLSLYTTKKLKDIGGKSLKKDIDNLEKELKEQESSIDHLLQEKAQLQTKMDGVSNKIQKLEDEVKNEGGSYANKRQELMNMRVKLEAQSENYDTEMRSFASDTLPFLFSKNLCLRTKESILNESELKNKKYAYAEINNRLKIVDKEIRKDTDLMKKIKSKDDFYLAVNEMVQRLSGHYGKEIGKTTFIHNLSNEEEKYVLTKIDKTLNGDEAKLTDLTKKILKTVKRKSDIERAIKYAPEKSIISPIMEKINSLNKELGMLQQEQNHVIERIKQEQFKMAKTKRDLEKIIDEYISKDKTTERIKLVGRIQNVLDEYEEKLREQKISQFNNTFIEVFNSLARKKNLYTKIEIDPKTYSVSIYKNGKKKIDKSLLSAGEKQIYAISVLWALTKLSGRPLPFIIDTPLGRLDREHRDTIVNKFFPNASHQTIILSTDTEIDSSYYQKIKSKIARNYYLDYSDGKTTVEEGYFWG